MPADRESEVGDAHAAVGAEQEVRGLDVAVDQTGGVRGGEPAGGLGVEADERAPVVARADARRERVAGDELGREEHLAVDLADVVDREHVRVGEAGEGAGLAEQALALLAVIRTVGPYQLDRDLAVELGIPGGPHLAHAAGGDPAVELVAPDAARLPRAADRAEPREHGSAGLALRDVGLDRTERGLGERALDEANELVFARAGGHRAVHAGPDAWTGAAVARVSSRRRVIRVPRTRRPAPGRQGRATG